MDINKLKAFIVVAEELNFRKSAELLGMSQPPLTRLINSFEEELGAKLFERTTRLVKLTPAGILLLRESREIMNHISRVESEIKKVEKIKAGTIKIGFSRTAFMARIPSIIEEFQKHFPKIKIELQEKKNNELLKLVQNGVLDMAFIEESLVEHELETREISRENLGALINANNPLAKKKELDFTDLKNEVIILHNKKEAGEFFDRVAHLLTKAQIKPKIYIKKFDESCPILVATGKGVSLTIAGSQNIAPHLTKFVPIKDLFLPVKIYWSKERLSPQLNTLISFIVEGKSVINNQQTECIHF